MVAKKVAAIFLAVVVFGSIALLLWDEVCVMVWRGRGG